jgi:hypothetical protein
MRCHRLLVDRLFNEIGKEKDFIHKKGITKRVPAIISVIIFIRLPGAQETPYCRVLLNRLIVFLLLQGGVVPIPKLIVVVLVF